MVKGATQMGTISATDEANFRKIRTNVSGFISESGKKYDKAGMLLLDIAPQDHEGAKPYFPLATVETLDIDAGSGATYIADLCSQNESVVPSGLFDAIVCTEVLEHTLQPFDAVAEMYRMLKKGGYVFVSAPFNFRIHGPLPDCWRFTEHGLKALFKQFEIVELTGLEDPERFLMPTHYTLIAKR
jgi:SAM-dependent methyltransferase